MFMREWVNRLYRRGRSADGKDNIYGRRESEKRDQLTEARIEIVRENVRR